MVNVICLCFDKLVLSVNMLPYWFSKAQLVARLALMIKFDFSSLTFWIINQVRCICLMLCIGLFI